MSARPPTLRVGASGWNYPDWRGRFYPPDLRAADYLEFYSGHFDTTEVNYSFCHLPSPATHEKWPSQAPPGRAAKAPAPESC